MYTWVDDRGDRHLVDSREKVPPQYRGRAREITADDSRPASQAGREPQRPPEAPTTKSGGAPTPGDAASDSGRVRSRVPEAAAGWLDRIRADWLVGMPTLPSARGIVARWLPREHLLEVVALAVAAAVLVRALALVGARRAARGLVRFGARYRSLFENPGGRRDPAQLDGLESDLPRVHRWCRAARLGVTTLGASREVGMGRVMDEGRIDALSACLKRPELVAQHTLTVLARAEGVHLHRARRPLTLLGCFEVLAYWPRYLVWRGGDDEPGGVRVLLSLYWLAVLLSSLYV